MPPFIQNIINSKKAVTLIGAGLVALIAFVWIFTSFNNVQKTMVSKEQALSAQYSDNQNELSSYISTIKETLGLADRNTDALDRVLSDAVKGRYEGETTAQPGGADALFSAIVEAYPDLAGVTDAYAKVQDAVIGGRAAYKNQQTKLLDMLRDYETWKNSGFIHSKIASMVGAPSDNLRAAVGDDTARGQQALDRMYRIVLTAEGNKAYESGEMEPMDLNPANPEPTSIVPPPSAPAAQQ